MVRENAPEHNPRSEIIIGNSKNMTAKQKSIVEAAIQLISEKGYSATSTSEIAKQAGVAEGTIFRHYETKKDLLVAIIEPGITHFAVPFFAKKLVEDVFEQTYTRFEDVLHAFIKNRFEFVQGNVPLLKIVLQELAFHPDLQETFKKSFTDKVYPVLNRTLDLYKEKGQLQDIPNESIIRMIVPTIIGFMITRFVVQPNKEWNDEEEIRRTTLFIMNGIGK